MVVGYGSKVQSDWGIMRGNLGLRVMSEV
jgi:hypothetical protein